MVVYTQAELTPKRRHGTVDVLALQAGHACCGLITTAAANMDPHVPARTATHAHGLLAHGLQ
jgi:hypothetical protein